MSFETFQQYPPVDGELVDRIVCKLKSQGIFDQFRKDCLADVDTKPAYQNLQQRVNGTVATFLATQTWQQDLNKTQLRESLRRHVQQGFLEVGVDRIVDQVVNPKVFTVFMPKVEDVVYDCLGIEKPKHPPPSNNILSGRKLTLLDLLPKDLDPVSPESDNLSFDDDETKDETNNNESSSKLDISQDSQVSGISDLSSHMGDSFKETQDNNMDSNTLKSVTSGKENSSEPHFENFENLSEKIKQSEIGGHNSTPSPIPEEQDKMELKVTSEIEQNLQKDNREETLMEIDSVSNSTFEDAKTFGNKIIKEDTFSRTISEDSLSSSSFNAKFKTDKSKSVVVEANENSVDKSEVDTPSKELSSDKEVKIPSANEDVTDIKPEEKLAENKEPKKTDEQKDKKQRESSSSRTSKSGRPSESKHRYSSDKKDDSKQNKEKSSKEDKEKLIRVDTDKEKEKSSKDDKDRSSKHKDDRHHSSKDKYKDKDKNDRSRERDGDKKKEKSDHKESSEKDKKSDKDKYKDKEKNDKEKSRNEKENHKYDKEKSRSDKDKDRHEKDKYEKNKRDKEREKRDKDKYESKEKDRDSNEKDKDKNEKDRSRERDRGKNEKDKESRSVDDKKRDSKKYDKTSSSSSGKKDDNNKNEIKEKSKRSDENSKEKSSSSKSGKSEEEKRERKRKSERCNEEIKLKEARRSWDRDSSGGNGKGHGSQKSNNSECKVSSSSSSSKEKRSGESSNQQKANERKLEAVSEAEEPSDVDKILMKINSSIEESQNIQSSDEQAIKKPKIARNIFEIRKIMQARKNIARQVFMQDKKRRENMDSVAEADVTDSPSTTEPPPRDNPIIREENKENIKAGQMDKSKNPKVGPIKGKFNGFLEADIEQARNSLQIFRAHFSNFCTSLGLEVLPNDDDIERVDFTKVDNSDDLLDDNLNKVKPKQVSLERRKTYPDDNQVSKAVENIMSGKNGCYVLLQDCNEVVEAMRNSAPLSKSNKQISKPQQNIGIEVDPNRTNSGKIVKTPERVQKKENFSSSIVKPVPQVPNCSAEIGSEVTSNTSQQDSKPLGSSAKKTGIRTPPSKQQEENKDEEAFSPVADVTIALNTFLNDSKEVLPSVPLTEAMLDNLMQQSSIIVDDETFADSDDSTDDYVSVKKNEVSEESGFEKEESSLRTSGDCSDMSDAIVTPSEDDEPRSKRISNVINTSTCHIFSHNKDLSEEAKEVKVAKRRNQRLCRSASQRYDSTDLYKPRPVLPQNSKRVRAPRSVSSDDVSSRGLYETTPPLRKRAR